MKKIKKATLIGIMTLVSSISCFGSDPANCFKDARSSLSGLGLNQENAIKLCSGSADQTTTIDCYKNAKSSIFGLGLNQENAIKLCSGLADQTATIDCYKNAKSSIFGLGFSTKNAILLCAKR